MPKEYRRIFQPFGDMLTLLSDLARLMEDALEEGNEINRTGETKSLFGVKGLKVKYGYSVRVGVSENPFEKKNCRSRREVYGIRGENKTNLLVDVFDEKKHIKVLAWLPGIRGRDIKLDIAEKTLTLRVDLPDRQQREEIELPARVRLEDVSAVYREGILEVTLKKADKSIKSAGKQ